MTNLKLDLFGAYDAGENRHAQEIMTSLGIVRTYDVPQSVSDCWMFFGCDNVPAELPSYISIMNVQDFDALVGHGLNQEMADVLTDKARGIEAK